MPRKRVVNGEAPRTCGNCSFWNQEDPKEDIGHCHRYPPIVHYDAIENELSSTVPRSWKEYWCGEFIRRVQ